MYEMHQKLSKEQFVCEPKLCVLLILCMDTMQCCALSVVVIKYGCRNYTVATCVISGVLAIYNYTTPHPVSA